eukprot:CAMPEP_0114526274 /NCGR_PEP_ID=MMETSP0109-20121206/22926_1 /TAXON_ID=29199 /ORGANISM="Chlorarachnion reptans, Strain CCCM449" /LENGTH=491 /DNA_ID=CAMNT_0001708023 /DNA_START=27 /DNA_END=1502 /DNA_ORIENTATION=+
MANLRRVLLLLTLSAATHPVCAAGAHGDEERWEWAGVFQLNAGQYTFNFARKSGSYAAAHMKIVMLATDELDSHGIEEQESVAEPLYEGNVTAEIEQGGVIVPSNSTNYEVDMDSNAYLTLVKVNVTSSGPYVFFMEHNPSEFEGSDHYLKDYDGEDVTASATEPATASSTTSKYKLGKSKATGLAVLATFVTCLPTLVVIFVAWYTFDVNSVLFKALSGFGAGVLCAAAALHIYPEAIGMLGSIPESELGWKSGSVVITGVLTGLILDSIPTLLKGGDDDDVSSGKAAAVKDIELKSAARTDMLGSMEDIKQEPEGGFCNFNSVKSYCWAILFGDLFHNVVDGILIGTAFRSCGVSKGWTIALVIIAHELPQEVADFFILVDGGMKQSQAITINFLTSLSAIIGAIVVTQNDVSSKTQGYLLCLTVGVFLYAALAGVVPNIFTKREYVVPGVLAFIFGCFVVGLSVIRHDHCVASGGSGGSSDAHAGHNH